MKFRKVGAASLFAFLATVICCAFVITMPNDNAQAMSSKNKKIRAAYEKKIAKLDVGSVKYADIVGNTNIEAIVEGRNSVKGSTGSIKIYSYNKEKIKRILNLGSYSTTKVIAYKKTKSIVTYGNGHGNEWYRYCKYKNGKYKVVAGKSRVAINGGNTYNGPWNYYIGVNETATTKSKFKSAIKGMIKGKRKTVKLY